MNKCKGCRLSKIKKKLSNAHVFSCVFVKCKEILLCPCIECLVKPICKQSCHKRISIRRKVILNISGKYNTEEFYKMERY